MNQKHSADTEIIWKDTRLDEIGRIVAGGTPSTSNPDNWNGPVAWVTPADLSGLRGRHLATTERTLTELGLATSAARLLPPRSLVISSRAPIGHMALPLVSFCTNQGCKTIEFFDGQDPDFHYYNLCFWVRRLHDKGEGTTFSEISKKALEAVEVPVPSNRKVQETIASVLALLDLAIEQTEALLAKQLRVKTGLMHDLFTRGLDAQGRLRDVSNHQFKPSVFGPIPELWDVKPLAQCTQFPITYGIVQAGPHVPGGIPYIRTGDMGGDELIRGSMLCTSAEVASHFRRSEVRAGEIVCAIRATVGKVLPVPENLDGANLTQGTARISPNSSTHGRFLLWSLRAYRTQQEISLQSKGTTFAEITLTDLRKIPVIMPRDFGEQVRIARIIDESDEVLRATLARLGKLKRTKNGLMQDLLTGRVPVTPLLANPKARI